MITLVSSTGLISQDVKTIKLKTNDIIYIPSEDRIYVSIRSDQINGNSVCAIDPYYGKIEECYFIGGSPNKMALSNDSNFLYIGLDDFPQIVRFNLSTKTIQDSFSLGMNQFNLKLFAEDIAVLPGDSNSIAVARRNYGLSPKHEGVAIYDNGIMRPLTTPSHTGSNSISFVETSGRLFGYNNESSQFGIREIGISPEGATNLSVTEWLITSFSAIIKSQDKFLYSSHGERINVEHSLPQLSGRYSFNIFTKAQVIPAPDTNLVFFITSNFGADYNLLTFNKSSYSKIDSINLPASHGDLRNGIAWGNQGKLAFNTDEVVTIMRNCTSLITDTLALLTAFAGGCWGDTVLVSAPDGYENYMWSNGDTTQSISVNNPGEFYFSIADSLGCLSAPSNVVKVEFDYMPSMPYIWGNDSIEICSGQSAVLTASGSTNNFLWSNGETGYEIEVDSPGTYSVINTANSGCQSLESNEIAVIVLNDTVPDPPLIEVIGETVFCSGESVLLTISEDYNYKQWSNGSNHDTIKVNYSGLFSIRVGSNSQCMSLYSEPVEILVKWRPATPSILSNGNLLASSSGTGNQWFFNGNPITGANEQFYHATENGFYTVQVTVDGCISDMSPLYNHFLVNTYESPGSQNIKFFPNPTSDQINFILGEEINHLFDTIEVFDLTGNALLRFTYTNSISLNNLPDGLYIVRVRDKSGNNLKNQLISKF